MAVPKRKVSKMKRRQRQAANRYEGVQASFCKECGKPVAPHSVCTSCGDGQDLTAFVHAAAGADGVGSDGLAAFLAERGLDAFVTVSGLALTAFHFGDFAFRDSHDKTPLWQL